MPERNRGREENNDPNILYENILIVISQDSILSPFFNISDVNLESQMIVSSDSSSDLPSPAYKWPKCVPINLLLFGSKYSHLIQAPVIMDLGNADGIIFT